ncbi:MAG: hypothetical protein WBE14_09400 [Xanthobacteraceae bacterium]
MPISDIPILSMLRIGRATSRHRTSAESCLWSHLSGWSAHHIAGPSGGGDSPFATDKSSRYEIRPRGNSVSHEDEMMKVASNQMDYEAVTSIYTHTLGLIKIAIDRS